MSPTDASALLGSAERLGLDDLQSRFDARPGYLAACTAGIPPRETVTALAADLAEWSGGHRGLAGYGLAVEEARAAFARLVGVPAEQVATGSQVSVTTGMIAASLPEGSEVLVVDGDFSSMVFPFLVQQQRGRLTVRCVPLDELAAAIEPSTTLVSFSLVQSATGALADADAIVSAAARHGAATYCDTTQAAGWMPVDASRYDVTVCHAYKWLCSPRGASFMTVTPEFAERLVPVDAGWYAGDEVWGSCYGPGMQLAATARRFDVSPAWPVWIGAARSLELFASADLEAVRAHDVGLADELRSWLELPVGGSTGSTPIVSWPDPDGSAFAALTAAGIAASSRAGRARVAFHLWNSPADVALVQTALAPLR